MILSSGQLAGRPMPASFGAGFAVQQQRQLVSVHVEKKQNTGNKATPKASTMSKSDSGAETVSPSDSVIAGDFGALSAEEQEKQREEWKSELAKTEEEILTLKQVLTSKEAHAAGLKRRLGITAWREFSEDMAHGLKAVQDSAAYKMTAEGINVAKEKTLGWMGAVTASTSFQSVSGKMNTAFGAAKSKVSAAMNTTTPGEVHEGSSPVTPTDDKTEPNGTKKE